jgi:hypothetical protein
MNSNNSPEPDNNLYEFEDDDLVFEPESTSEGILSYISEHRVAAGAVLVGGALAAFGLSRLKPSLSLSAEEMETALAKKKEMVLGERKFKSKHGGEVYNMSRLPGDDKTDKTDDDDEEGKSKKKKTKARKKNKKEAKGLPKVKGLVYIRVPKEADPSRAVLFLHGNGEQKYNNTATMNIVKCTEKLKLPLIAPQDGWGNTRPEKKSDLPGNWENFNDPKLMAGLIGLMEGTTGESVDELIVASFSGGNIGIAKILRGLERSSDPEAKAIYDRIKRIALFDSASGEAHEYMARWMSNDSDGRLFSYYNKNQGGIRGFVRRGNLSYKGGNALLRKALKTLKVPEERYTIETLPKRLRGHSVFTSKCVEYLKSEE